MNLLRLFHTLIHLKPIQIRYQLWYRIRSKIGFQFPESDDKIPECSPLNFSQWINKPKSFSDDQFTFLNQSQKFSNNKIEWNSDKYGKLWAYNLNYMDYLLQEDIREEQGIALIRQFVEDIHTNSTGKEPYPISLRGINWIKFLSKNSMNDAEINTSLFNQYQVLIYSLEYHLLGNHLLENGFSLLFGGFYFKNELLYKKAKQILEKELREQILDDGGHFELSPMYHQIILDRLLDAINLVKNNQQFSNQNELLIFFEQKAKLMLSWLNNMTFSNGDIPHFNDSTDGIAPTSEQLFDYARRLNLNPCPERSRRVNLSSSGYRKFKSNNYECKIDIGPLGPDYIPGHAHADMLSFVLYFDGKPMIIDTSISTYEKNAQRQLERSTSSHNTVALNNKNQSDVWVGFRVGKRAQIKILSDNTNFIEAEHNGYKPIMHKRSFDFKAKGFEIIDTLSESSDSAVAFFHFAPNIVIRLNGSSLVLSGKYLIRFTNYTNIVLAEFNYPNGYNKYSKSTKCEVSFSRSLQTNIITNED